MDWTGQTFLAPLTKGGNLPFRRLCVDFGAPVTVSEMAWARQVVRRSKPELALLRRHASETCFGVQLAVGRAADGIAAARAAIERGARFIDINAGCPIHDVVRRGMGATLLRRPEALARLVEAMAGALDVPVSVKIRSGWCAAEINASEVARLCEEAGAAALIVHGRSREQRYTRSADWELIGRLVGERSIPVIGNGDILTWYEARDRLEASGCASVMVARGALIKPWLFEEIRSGRTWLPTAAERVGVYYRFACYLKEHFRDDAKGRERAMRFLPWHLDFFCRYRPLPEEPFRALSRRHPLLQTRLPSEPDLPPLEALLRDPRPEVHARIAAELWDAGDAADATDRLSRLAAALPPCTDEAGEIPVAHG